MSEQLALPAETWPCNVCRDHPGFETDPETLRERRCRVCGGTAWLPYDPAGGPFATLETQE